MNKFKDAIIQSFSKAVPTLRRLCLRRDALRNTFLPDLNPKWLITEFGQNTDCTPRHYLVEILMRRNVADGALPGIYPNFETEPECPYPDFRTDFFDLYPNFETKALSLQKNSGICLKEISLRNWKCGQQDQIANH
jgi:hypothetical protein